MTLVAVWKEAGFFMIFYLAALQAVPPVLAEAAALEGASRWTYFRRVQLPLLMPTTLFVLINAVINAFRTADLIIVMTRGGPDNATSLLLFHIYQVGFTFWDTFLRRRADPRPDRAARGRGPGPVRLARAQGALSMSGTADVTLAPLAPPVAATRAARRAPACSDPYAPRGIWRLVEGAGAGLLALLWIAPLLFAAWAAFHAPDATTRLRLDAPLTLENFERAWEAAPFARYVLNTVVLVTLIFACQVVLGTLSAYAFARFDFPGRGIAFALVLVQLMIMPDVLIVENYRTMTRLGLVDTIPGIALPYIASAFGIFLLRQTFKTVPRELDDAARVEGAGALRILLRVYVPLARPVYIAYGLVSVTTTGTTSCGR